MEFFFRPDENNGYLSNWYPCIFRIDGTDFINAEQYFMYSKALLFKDNDMAQKILDETRPDKIKELGRKIKNFDDKEWCRYREEIMLRGLYHKFSQNIDLRNKLLSTQDKILAEASPYDKIWGIGLSIDDPRIYNVGTWRGLNLLGKCLMIIRKQLT